MYVTQTNFSARELLKVLFRNRFRIVNRTGSNVKLRYEHPTNDDNNRIVIVPMHDSIKTGTLRSIANQAGAKNFQKIKDWINQNI
ncbi:hypothetical protein AKJ56_01575 [candidate division MSBL1 archaeon SCGC-AAA382N08]|uniref:Type II toxin-antitoxin system HicA family toxin n=1 Tax=candidate division MSBL1 archaeon SCGC-AAA382N08 TaxID=1698285 RepID=A0A133VPD3_9EURY|nr:hypothetical protein AKJ56_01575 [candidate division MSBL1 archaeon SCGC-AAA382N08]